MSINNDLKVAAHLILSQWLSQKIYHYLNFPRCQTSQKSISEALAWEDDQWQAFIEQALADIRLEPEAYPWAWPLGLDKAFQGSLRRARAELGDLKAWSQYRLIAAGDDYYPQSLSEISDPPAILFGLGSPELLQSEHRVAIIGARKASPHALHEGRELGQALAEAGVLVVSGGALGSDSAAHWGALAARRRPGSTAVVFAGGVDQWYPSHNLSMFRSIEDSGGLFLSERLPGSPSRPFDFPVRNRIVTGLAEHVVVLQADLKSGTMGSAKLALEQGRDLWVLEHDSDDMRALGSHKLIEDGARSFKRARDLLDEWGL